MLVMLRQQAALLEELHREVRDDNRLIESRVNELPTKLDDITSSLVSIVSHADSSQRILSVHVISLTDHGQLLLLPIGTLTLCVEDVVL